MSLKFPRIKTEKIVAVFKKRAFFFLTSLFVLCVAFSGLVFYRYTLQSQELPPNEEITKVDKEMFSKIIKKLNNRDKNIEEDIKQEIPDVFK